MIELVPGNNYGFGRGDNNDFIIELEAVSREHLIVSYDKELGWVMENLSVNSSTWIHPKLYSQIFVADKSNSPPMFLRSGSIVKARSFNFLFTY